MGDCDATETCDGASKLCPDDGVEPDTTVCRAQMGDCDVEETCDGSTKTCPDDAVEPAATVCRRAIEPCDTEERCDGIDKACPAVDVVLGLGTACGTTPTDACDAFDFCDGLSTGCTDRSRPAAVSDCCTPNATPGCATDNVLEACVCAIDPFCCNEQWDIVCAGQIEVCGGTCDPPCP
jgi:hypothetical protein